MYLSGTTSAHNMQMTWDELLSQAELPLTITEGKRRDMR